MISVCETGFSGVKNVVLVRGAFADSSSWAKVIPLLQARGYNTVAVQNPLTSFQDDVAATNRIIDLMDGPVLLLGHFYGGMVISEAPAWETKPSWAIVAAKDGMINPDLERFKAKLIKANTIELSSSHVPMVSQPDKVAEFIISAAETL